MAPLTIHHFSDLRPSTDFDTLIGKIVAHPLVYHVKQCKDEAGLNVLVEGRRDGDRYVLQFVPDSAPRHWSLDHVDWYPRPHPAADPPSS